MKRGQVSWHRFSTRQIIMQDLRFTSFFFFVLYNKSFKFYFQMTKKDSSATHYHTRLRSKAPGFGKMHFAIFWQTSGSLKLTINMNRELSSRLCCVSSLCSFLMDTLILFSFFNLKFKVNISHPGGRLNKLVLLALRNNINRFNKQCQQLLCFYFFCLLLV